MASQNPLNLSLIHISEFGGRIDILALDREGNIVVVECKRDRTPRDIIAQILDYASWVSKLSTREVHEIAQAKLNKRLEVAFQELSLIHI